MTKPTGRPRGRPPKGGHLTAGQQAIHGILSSTPPAAQLTPAGTRQAGNSCPRCGKGVLLEKTGQFGAFLGCSEWPLCRHTERAPAVVSQSENTAQQAPLQGGPQQGTAAAGEPSNEPSNGGGQAQVTTPQQQQAQQQQQQTGNEPLPVPPPFVPQSPIEQLIADIARQVASGLDVEVLNAVRQAMEQMAANLPALLPQLPAPQLPAGIASIRIPRKSGGEQSDIALAQRIVKRLRSGPVMLIGPSGCGKTHIAGIVAQLMKKANGEQGLRFGGISFTSGIGEGVLQGRLIPLAPDPIYLSTEFVEFFVQEEGGLFLADEVDAADPNPLLTLNQAIANGRLPLPARFGKPYAMRSPNFHLIATMNTDGRGQTRNHGARQAQDAAFLDRFVGGYFRMDYDRELELRLCLEKGGTEKLAQAIWALRDRSQSLGMFERGVLITTRAIIRAANLMQDGLTEAEAVHEIIVRFNPDEQRKLLEGR